jgi:hypothetical protein
MNICLFSDSGEIRKDLRKDLKLRRRDLFERDVEHNPYCTSRLRGLFQKTLNPSKPVPSKILIFPGSDVTHFLSRAEYPGDGRHYGYGMYLPFFRTFQGIAHEYALATPKIQSHLIALGDSTDPLSRHTSKLAWNSRLISCSSEIQQRSRSIKAGRPKDRQIGTSGIGLS